jgi:hypothetical protein
MVDTHQGAMAMVVDGDWTQARKYFSLSDNYEQWKDFTMPARGIGLRALVVAKNVSDKTDGGDFDAEDERRLKCLATAAAVGLDALRKVRALRLGEQAPAAPLEAAASFVVIESV